MNKAKIHNDSLINNYLPADYLDSFSKEVVVNKNITPDTFFDMVFNRFPAWIDWLLKAEKQNSETFRIRHYKSLSRFCV